MALLKRKTRLKTVAVKKPVSKKRASKKMALPENTWVKVQTAEGWKRENKPCA